MASDDLGFQAVMGTLTNTARNSANYAANTSQNIKSTFDTLINRIRQKQQDEMAAQDAELNYAIKSRENQIQDLTYDARVNTAIAQLNAQGLQAQGAAQQAKNVIDFQANGDRYTQELLPFAPTPGSPDFIPKMASFSNGLVGKPQPVQEAGKTLISGLTQTHQQLMGTKEFADAAQARQWVIDKGQQPGSRITVEQIQIAQNEPNNPIVIKMANELKLQEQIATDAEDIAAFKAQKQQLGSQGRFIPEPILDSRGLIKNRSSIEEALKDARKAAVTTQGKIEVVQQSGETVPVSGVDKSIAESEARKRSSVGAYTTQDEDGTWSVRVPKAGFSARGPSLSIVNRLDLDEFKSLNKQIADKNKALVDPMSSKRDKESARTAISELETRKQTLQKKYADQNLEELDETAVSSTTPTGSEEIIGVILKKDYGGRKAGERIGIRQKDRDSLVKQGYL